MLWDDLDVFAIELRYPFFWDTPEKITSIRVVCANVEYKRGGSSLGRREHVPQKTGSCQNCAAHFKSSSVGLCYSIDLR